MNFAGAILLTFGAYFVGVILAKNEGDKLKSLEALADFLEFTKQRITLLQTPLYRVFTDYENEFLEDMGFLPLLRSNRNGIKQSWVSATDLLVLDDHVKKELMILGRDLGELPLEEQEKRIAVCLQTVNAKKEAMEGELPKKQKSIRTVALLVGAMTAILLV